MNRKVLIVDDERSIVDILRYNLEKNDMTAVCAYDGAEGLRLARECDPDVILLEGMLPEMDGCAACREIRKMERSDAKTVPIIAVTANAFAEDIARTTEAGMNGHIAKPIDFRLLIQLLETAMKKQED